MNQPHEASTLSARPVSGGRGVFLQSLRDRAWLLGLLLLAATILAYQPVWGAGFIWDDNEYVIDNLALRSWAGLWQIWFVPGTTPQYYPLTFTSFWVEYHLWGAHALGYHLINVCLHAVNALLVWLILRRLGVRGAWLGATVFALHPVNVESVAWVTERKNTLSGVFFLGSILAGLRFWLPETAVEGSRPPALDPHQGTMQQGVCARRDSVLECASPLALLFGGLRHRKRQPPSRRSGALARREGGRTGAVQDLAAVQAAQTEAPTLDAPDAGTVLGHWRWYWLALGLYVCALWSKTAGVGLPVALLLVVWWKRGRLKWRDIYLAAPFVVVGAGLGLLTMWTEKHYTGAVGRQWAFTWGERWVMAGRAAWFYLGKLVWPHPLIFVYPRWRIEAASVLPYVPVVAGVLVLGVCWWQRRGWGRVGLLALGCYLVLLFPVLGFFDVYYFRYSFVADHFQYLAMLGPLALSAGGITSVLGYFEKQRWFVEPAVCAAMLMVLGLLTWRQCGMYGDVETLWRTTIARNPDSYLAHNNLGGFLIQTGRAGEAIIHLKKALEIQPDYELAESNLGLALLQKGRADEAIFHYQRYLQARPGDAKAHNNLGYLLLENGRADEAIAQYQQALGIRPDYAEAHQNLGTVLIQRGRVDEAITHFQKAVEIEPKDAPAHNSFGVALFQKWRTDEAIAHFQAALEIQGDFAMAHNNLANALLRKGQVPAAIAHYQKALENEPNNAEVLKNLAWVLATSPEASVRNGSKAVELAQRASQLSGSQDPKILRTLAAAYAEAGRFDEAVAMARQAQQLAIAQGNTTLADLVQAQLGLYQTGVAFRDKVLTNAPVRSGLP